MDVALEDLRSTKLRIAQLAYFVGMAMAVPLVGGGLWLVNWTFGRPTILSTAGLGALGAIVSVLTRMTTGKLQLRHEAGRGLLLLFGAFRPVVGSIFGVAVWLLVAGGVFPIEVTAGQKSQLYFYSGVAFLAGFSERFAKTCLDSPLGDCGPPKTTRAAQPLVSVQGLLLCCSHRDSRIPIV